MVTRPVIEFAGDSGVQETLPDKQHPTPTHQRSQKQDRKEKGHSAVLTRALILITATFLHGDDTTFTHPCQPGTDHVKGANPPSASRPPSHSHAQATNCAPDPNVLSRLQSFQHPVYIARRAEEKGMSRLSNKHKLLWRQHWSSCRSRKKRSRRLGAGKKQALGEAADDLGVDPPAGTHLFSVLRT